MADMAETPPVVLTIAGFDPSSGAGVTADLKTIAAHACYGVACITALTVQSTKGVQRVSPTDAGLVRETLDELVDDIRPAAVRIGMLGSAGVVSAVVEFLESARPKLQNVVLDPVCKSSSGFDLLDPAGAKLLRDKLMPICDVVTPNREEALFLTGVKIANEEDLRQAATKLHEAGACAAVITGGDLHQAIDLLSFKSKKGVQQEIFRAPKLLTNSTHGTGCAFATAMACQLALDRGLAEATLLAKVFVLAAMGAAYPVGRGKGPLNHLYRMGESKRAPQTAEGTDKPQEQWH
jgi:hydroxymethylpyrimidine/phosphomethylpyrimidine kinase